MLLLYKVARLRSFTGLVGLAPSKAVPIHARALNGQVGRRDPIQRFLDPGLVEKRAERWELLEEHEYRRQEPREEEEDAVGLYYQSDHGPAVEHDGEAREEGYAAPPRPLP